MQKVYHGKHGKYTFTLGWKQIWIAGIAIMIWTLTDFWIALLALASHLEMTLRK